MGGPFPAVGKVGAPLSFSVYRIGQGTLKKHYPASRHGYSLLIYTFIYFVVK